MKLSHEEKISLLQGLVNYVTPDLLGKSDIRLNPEQISACIFDAARTQMEDITHLREYTIMENQRQHNPPKGEGIGNTAMGITFYSFQVGESIVSMMATIVNPVEEKDYLEARKNPGNIRSTRTKINEDGVLYVVKDSPSKRDDIFWTFGVALEFVENWMVNRNLENNTPEAKKLKRGHRL